MYQQARFSLASIEVHGLIAHISKIIDHYVAITKLKNCKVRCLLESIWSRKIPGWLGDRQRYRDRLE